ncbi:MAG: hypothetical protein E7401_03755 [Ruminococcaceae bacterium]|nr:hypothetical protein [Oscillospiraceae bacterium]
MKKITKVFLGILTVFITLIFAFGVWQWNNIVAVYKTVTTTQEQLENEINKNKQALEEELNQKYSTIVRDFSAEDERQIIKGEITVEQAVEKLNDRYKKKKNEKTANDYQTQANAKKIDELIGDKVIELYSLKAYYLGQLGQMEATVKSEYAAMPAEKKNLVGKKELVSKHMGVALGLMNQCDAKVEALIAELETELKKIGGDTSIIRTIKNAYENEKALKKAQYLKLLDE